MSIRIGSTEVTAGAIGASALSNIALGSELLLTPPVVTPPADELFQGNAAADRHGEVAGTAGWSAVGDVTVASATTDPQTGSEHIVITATVDSGNTGDRGQYEIPVENGEEYDVTIWARESVGSDGRIQTFAGVSGWSTVLLTGTWTEYTQRVTATSTTMTMRFYPSIGGSNGDQIYIDNISVVKVTT